jgi:hypothetical protein
MPIKTKKPTYDSIPKRVELFGRSVVTVDDSTRLNISGGFGEARYAINQIAMSTKVKEIAVSSDELKLTYLHEMLHFILNFTGYEGIIKNKSEIDLEQFIELLASGIYQYEKTAEY